MITIDGKRLVTEDGSARERIGGFETEYGLSCSTQGPDTNSYNRDAYSEEVAKLVIRRAHGPRHFDRREFGTDGDRHYLDVGDHPELSTAEDTSFTGSAHRVARGHVKMARLYEESAEQAKIASSDPNRKVRIDLLANTCDPDGNSWSSHENLIASRKLMLKDYVYALIVHNLSRIVWSGAGLVIPDSSGFKFCLSEKANHIWSLFNASTMNDRPLVNTRDEPLARRRSYRRIHGTTGETVMSPFTNALRLASGSIILRACELGVDFSDLMPEEPTRAIREISNDPSLKKKVRLANGHQFSGLELQQKIAERSIEAATNAEYITAQEKTWGERWLKLCTDLADDPQKCAKRTDWVVKQNLIDREVSAKRYNGESDGAIALAKAVDYHRLLPNEGAGMRLLRKGWFEESPTSEILDTGLVLPHTRAKLRGQAVARLDAVGRNYSIYWNQVKIDVAPGTQLKAFFNEPYATEDEQLDALLDTVAM